MLGAVLLRDPDLGELDQCLLVEDRAGAGGQVDPEHSAVLGFDLALLADRGDDGGGVDDGSAVAAEHDLADCAVLLGIGPGTLLRKVRRGTYVTSVTGVGGVYGKAGRVLRQSAHRGEPFWP